MYSPVQSIKGKIIFLSPLDWGLGHASRCVPIIATLCKHNTLILGVTALNRHFLDLYFPQVQKIQMPSYGIRYAKRLPVFFKLLLQIPRVLKVLKNERDLLRRLITHYQIDLVISDSRLGCYSNKVKSILITHQLNLQVPMFSRMANAINRKWIKRFNEVWVPDYKEIEQRLSGALSSSFKTKAPVFYIGPQSALQKNEPSDFIEPYDILILLSGVESQRSLLEEKLIKALDANTKKIILVRGSATPPKGIPSGIEVHNFAHGQSLAELIVRAKQVVCRSGYSTLMDLHLLGKKDLVLIPTPGQSEQEYLAEYWLQKFQAKVCQQKDIKKGLF